LLDNYFYFCKVISIDKIGYLHLFQKERIRRSEDTKEEASLGDFLKKILGFEYAKKKQSGRLFLNELTKKPSETVYIILSNLIYLNLFSAKKL
jgi:hypothetical protein